MVFKGLGNLASLMKSAQEMGGKMQQVQDDLRQQRVSGAAGGGMVEVELNGLGEVLNVKLDPVLVERNEREMLEDLLPAAINAGIAKSKQLHIEAMKGLTAGVNLPGLEEALEQMSGHDTPPNTPPS